MSTVTDNPQEIAEQLLLFSELTSRLAPGSQGKLQFAVITKAKSPAVDLHVGELEAGRKAAADLERRLMTLSFSYQRRTVRCWIRVADSATPAAT